MAKWADDSREGDTDRDSSEGSLTADGRPGPGPRPAETEALDSFPVGQTGIVRSTDADKSTWWIQYRVSDVVDPRYLTEHRDKRPAVGYGSERRDEQQDSE